MIEVSDHSCGDLFCIEAQKNSEIPHLNMIMKNKSRFENDRGFGLYFFRFSGELLYVGSYCGSSGVAKDRWWTHLAGISCRFKCANFTNLSSKRDPKLAALLANNNLQEIDRLLAIYKERFDQTYSTIAENENFRQDIFEKLMLVTSHASKPALTNLLGDGRCSTFERRVKVANDRWDIFRDLSADDISRQFSFQYIRVSDRVQEDPLVRFLYSDANELSKKRRLVQRFIEDRLIESLLPPANKVKPPLSEEEFDEAVIAASLRLVDQCLELAAK